MGVSNLQELQFYATPVHPCSYKDKHQAKTLFVDPKTQLDTLSYSELTDMGFRRSGQHVYRPHCESCNACLSARIPVSKFRFSKSQKRVINANSDITIHITRPSLTTEIYKLYEKYISCRHYDGDMYPASQEQFKSFLINSGQETYFLEFRLDQQLIAVAVVDQLHQGLSAIYTFFDPDEHKRSLGKFAILKQIQITASQGLPYLYLGYWISGCAKMDYKIQYRPLEILVDNQWVSLESQDPTPDYSTI